MSHCHDAPFGLERLQRLAPPKPAETNRPNQTATANGHRGLLGGGGELIYGAERAAAAHRANNRMLVERLRQQFVSVPFDDAAAEEYGKVRAHLAALGMPIGPNDLLIAAIALAKGLMVVTNNTAEFNRVPGLSVEDWQK